MILSSAIRAFVYTEAVDMRKSIDTLSQLVSLRMALRAPKGRFQGQRGKTITARLWAALYDFSVNRAGEHPRRILG
jgi:transposase